MNTYTALVKGIYDIFWKFIEKFITEARSLILY